MSRINGSIHYHDLADCDIIIETINSQKPGANLEERLEVLRKVEAVVKPDTVITSNTATMMISDLAIALEHPERLLGMHFISPVSRINLVEVVSHFHTNEASFLTVKSLQE